MTHEQHGVRKRRRLERRAKGTRTHGLYGLDLDTRQWSRVDGGLPADIEVLDFAVHPLAAGAIPDGTGVEGIYAVAGL